MNFTFHQDVQTPNGPGVIQGRTADGRLMVSHRPHDLPQALRPERRAMWVLLTYSIEQIKPQGK